MRMLIWAHTAKFDALHSASSRWRTPLRWCLRVLLRWWRWRRLLMLDRRKIVFGSLSLHLRHLLALCKLICVASVDVWSAGIGTAEMLPNCCHLLAQHIVLFLQAARMVGILSEASIFLPQCFKLVLTGLDVITRCKDQHLNTEQAPKPIPLLRTSHLLDLLPGELGRMELRESNRSFISLRRLRSASLCIARNSGVRL